MKLNHFSPILKALLVHLDQSWNFINSIMYHLVIETLVRYTQLWFSVCRKVTSVVSNTAKSFLSRPVP